jgi:predicted nucleotidyltransferase
MNLIGFNEALQNALQVTISKNPALTISVASPAGTALLKLIAWFDRESEFRKKDSADIKYLMATYHKIPEIFDAIYDEGFAEKQGHDVLKASAVKLGTDINIISSPKIKNLLRDNIFLNETNMIEFSREMNSGINTDFDENFELLTLLGQGILIS